MNSLYNRWHKHPYHPHLHWSTFLATSLLATLFLLNQINQAYQGYPDVLRVEADTTTGLVAHYTFDEGSGTTAGDSAGSNTGTVLNGATWGEGRVGGAITLDGVDDYITTTFNVATNLNNSNFTISLWAKPTVSGVRRSFYTAADSGNSRFYFGPEVSTNTSLLGLSSWNPTLSNSSFINTWSHYVVVLEGTNGYLYRNGALIDSTSQITVSLPNSTIQFGRGKTSSLFLAGSLDDIRIYSRALSAGDVSELYAYTGGSSYPTPYATPYATPAYPTPSTEDPGNTVTAISCSQAHVQAAINNASDGNTVEVPAGECTWNSTVTVPNNKQLLLEGGGQGVTKITIGPINFGIFLGTSNSSVTGFTFQSSQAPNNFIQAQGSNGEGRIHHNEFINTAGSNRRCIYLSGGTGVPHPLYLIDHNTFSNCRVNIAGDLSTGFGKKEWETSRPWGTYTNCVYIEDNTFTYTHHGNHAEADYGACMVVRSNIITGPPTEMHSNSGGNGTGSKGGTMMEVYNNTYTRGSAGSVYAAWWRAGTGLIFNNTFSSFPTPIIFDVSNRSTVSGECDGTSGIDGNLGSGTTYPALGWPCFNQPGFGHYSIPFVADTYPQMVSKPIPMFLNRQGGSIVQPTFTNGSARHISDCNELQVERTNFNGSCGTGVGLISNLPSSCTTGVYYWATNEGEWNSLNSGPDGQLYKCTSTNTWSLYYTPYVYPHPLVSGAPAPAYTTPYTYPTPNTLYATPVNNVVENPTQTTNTQTTNITGVDPEETKKALIIQIMIQLIALLTQLIAMIKSGAAAALSALSSWRF